MSGADVTKSLSTLFYSFQKSAARYVCLYFLHNDSGWVVPLGHYLGSYRYKVLFNQLSNVNCAPIWGWWFIYVFALWLCPSWLWWRHTSVQLVLCLYYRDCKSSSMLLSFPPLTLVFFIITESAACPVVACDYSGVDRSIKHMQQFLMSSYRPFFILDTGSHYSYFTIPHVPIENWRTDVCGAKAEGRRSGEQSEPQHHPGVMIIIRSEVVVPFCKSFSYHLVTKQKFR